MKKMVYKILTILIVGLITYFAKYQFYDTTSIQILKIIGGIMIAVALIYLLYEVKHNYKFFYGKSQSAGSNANGSIVAGVGLGIFSTNTVELFVIMCSLMVYIILISWRYEIKREQE